MDLNGGIPKIRPFVFDPAKVRTPHSIRPLALGKVVSPMPFVAKKPAHQTQRSDTHSHNQKVTIVPQVRPSSTRGRWSNLSSKTTPSLGNLETQVSSVPSLTSNSNTDSGQGTIPEIEVESNSSRSDDNIPNINKNNSFKHTAVTDSSKLKRQNGLVVCDSSDDDFEFDFNKLTAEPFEYPQNTINKPSEPYNNGGPSGCDGYSSTHEEYVFDENLDPQTAIDIIKRQQAEFNMLSEQGIELIRCLEDAISEYNTALKSIIRTETEKKKRFISQWECAREEAEKLLNLVKSTVFDIM